MSCIKKEIIQKYIDGEANPKEKALIEKHLASCDKCAQNFVSQQKIINRVNEAINLLVTDVKEAPAFVALPSQARKRFLTKRKIIYSLSAACIILFMLIAIHEKVPVNHEQITIIHTLGPDVDANRPITEQPIVINVIDSKGNVSEFDVK